MERKIDIYSINYGAIQLITELSNILLNTKLTYTQLIRALQLIRELSNLFKVV